MAETEKEKADRLVAEKAAADARAAASAAAAASTAASTPPPAPRPKQDEFDFVEVRNNGKVLWQGADYKLGGDSVIQPGKTGRVTLKKARLLVSDYEPHAKQDDVAGPFEILAGD